VNEKARYLSFSTNGVAKEYSTRHGNDTGQTDELARIP
jgi:hypothetical protein